MRFQSFVICLENWKAICYKSDRWHQGKKMENKNSTQKKKFMTGISEIGVHIVFFHPKFSQKYGQLE
jgi:hypothetical protein